MILARKKEQVGRIPNEKMHEDLALGDNSPKASNNATAFYTKEHIICDGADRDWCKDILNNDG